MSEYSFSNLNKYPITTNNFNNTNNYEYSSKNNNSYSYEINTNNNNLINTNNYNIESNNYQTEINNKQINNLIIILIIKLITIYMNQIIIFKQGSINIK